MIIKVSNEYLEFNEDIEVEKQIKLVEEISTTDGDFSYSFELAKTIRNTSLLGNPQPDNFTKPVYQRIPASLLNNDGAEIYNGYLRIERITSVYECSFFAGNNNWFGMITGLLSDLNLSGYDQDLTLDNIQGSWANTEGLAYPLVDNGPLLTRSNRHLKVEDFIGGLYIKDIFQKVFNQAGIKLDGELFNDWMFLNAVCLSINNKDKVKDRSTYAGKRTIQTIVLVGPDPPIAEKLTWDVLNEYPYYDGSQGNFNLASDRYTADVKMRVEVEAYIDHYVVEMQLWIYKNGAPLVQIGEHAFEGPDWTQTQGKTRVTLEAGDYIEIYVVVDLPDPLSGPMDIIFGWLKVTPVFLYKTFGQSLVPQWTQQDFVSNVLRMFNCLPSYNANSGTLTINLFEKLRDKPSIDLSEHISTVEIDYQDFVSNYGQKSKLSYNEVEFEELRTYNKGKYFKYGQGYLTVNNDFIEPEVDIVESDFSNPIAYESSVFQMSMEKTNLIELEEGEGFPYSAVTDPGSGAARFAVVDDVFIVGDLVRIFEEVSTVYNGDWVVDAVGTGWVEFKGLNFSTDNAGDLTRLEHIYNEDDNAFLVINVPDYYVADFSKHEWFYMETETITQMALGYFDMIDASEPTNDHFKYSLSFGGIDDPRQYMIPMTDRYFSSFGRVLNDPVKLICTAHLPNHVYRSITFLEPITLKTMETTNRYYVNRITGYKESYLPCTIELIKLP